MVGKVIQRFYKTLTMFQNTWFETQYLLFIPSSLCIHHWCAQNLTSLLIFPKEPMSKNNVACVMTFWYLQFHTLHIDKCFHIILHSTRHWPCSTVCCCLFVFALTFPGRNSIMLHMSWCYSCYSFTHFRSINVFIEQYISEYIRQCVAVSFTGIM